MLRKLILLAITSGFAKKAWDKYRQPHAGHVTNAKWRPSTPVPRARSSDSKADSPARSRETKPTAS